MIILKQLKHIFRLNIIKGTAKSKAPNGLASSFNSLCITETEDKQLDGPLGSNADLTFLQQSGRN